MTFGNFDQESAVQDHIQTSSTSEMAMAEDKILPIAHQGAEQGLVNLHANEDGSCMLSLPMEYIEVEADIDDQSPNSMESIVTNPWAIPVTQPPPPVPDSSDTTSSKAVAPGRIKNIQQHLIELLKEQRAAGNQWISLAKAR
jgi:hypothetical protein